MLNTPAVCIMIPTYNQSDFIVKAVESALAQDYLNIEIVIADDASTDNTKNVLEPFFKHPRIKYKRNHQNIGRVANYKKCLTEYASTDWVINLDGDDYYTNNHFISQAMNSIQAHGINNTLFYQGGNVRKNSEIEVFNVVNINSYEESLTCKDYFFKFFERNFFCHMSTLYNRKVAIECNFYDTNILSTDIFSFLDLCLRFSEKKAIVSKNISGIWLKHTNNASITLNFKTHLDNFLLYIKLYRLAINRGFNKRLCFKWLMRASYIYCAGYALNFIEFIKNNEIQK